MDNLISVRLSELEDDLMQKKMRIEILTNNIKEKNMTDIVTLEQQLELFNSRQESVQELVKSKKEQKQSTELAKIKKSLLDTLSTKTNSNIIYNYSIPNTYSDTDDSSLSRLQGQLYLKKLEIESELMEAKNLKDKFLYNDEYRELQSDIEILNLQIVYMKNTFNRVMTSSPFHKNENILSLEKSMIKIDNSKKLLKLIIVNLLIILIGILLGLSIILFRNKKDIFK